MKRARTVARDVAQYVRAHSLAETIGGLGENSDVLVLVGDEARAHTGNDRLEAWVACEHECWARYADLSGWPLAVHEAMGRGELGPFDGWTIEAENHWSVGVYRD